jgi:dynein heavy chain
VDDITAVVIILLEANPKDKSWAAAQKLMNNVDKFLERLRGFKDVIDQGQVRHRHAAGTAKHSTACRQRPTI